MTPTEKQAARMKERKKKKKQRELVAKAKQNRAGDGVTRSRGIGGVKKDKKQALDRIVKSGRGVTVVGKSAQKGTKKVKTK
jgi:U3 small nucleolar RNA-associated protein MPP10